MSDKPPKDLNKAASNLGIAWEAESSDAKGGAEKAWIPLDEEKPPVWDPAAWDGLTEEEAFESDPDAVVQLMGVTIASQSWRGGSWSNVTEYKGRYYSTDEVETEEFDNAADAFRRANIGYSPHDEIFEMLVSPRYAYLLSQDDE